MTTKIILFIAFLASFQMTYATTYECRSYYDMKVDSKYISTYPISCYNALASMKDGYFCRSQDNVYNTKNFKTVIVLLQPGKDCEDVLNEMVDDKYCVGRYDIGSLMDGSVSFSHGGTCESVLYGN